MWCNLSIRLDIWHFMRRLASGCSSESHPLYATFMGRLSECIFEWDEDDYRLLLRAKANELADTGLEDPTSQAVRKAVSKNEMARHCRRATRGEEKTAQLIEDLLLALTPATDALGVPLFWDDMMDIWSEQKRHIRCIQDDWRYPLYTTTGHITKGRVKLPIYRCARGSTSLESFHLHLAKFIPGSAAGGVNFQAFLLEGITRWNYSRAAATIRAESGAEDHLRTFDLRLQQKTNELSQKVLGRKLISNFVPPTVYRGEAFGVDYLYRQSGGQLVPSSSNLESEIDEGFIEDEEQVQEQLPTSFEGCCDDSDPTVVCPQPSDSDNSENETEDDGVEAGEVSDTAHDHLGIPGWDRVMLIAEALCELNSLYVTDTEAYNIIELYGQLNEFDKKPMELPQRTVQRPQGRFARASSRRNRSGHTSVIAMNRCFLSGGSVAHSPSKSRVVEAVCMVLCNRLISEPTPGRVVKATASLKMVLREYDKIRSRLLTNSILLEKTGLNLFTVNFSTLKLWYQRESRRKEVALLLQGRVLPTPSTCADSPLQPALEQPTSPPSPPADEHLFPEAEDTTGLAPPPRRRSSVRSGITISPTLPVSASTVSVSASTVSVPVTTVLVPVTTVSLSSVPSSISVSASSPTTSLEIHTTFSSNLDVPTEVVRSTPKTTAWRHRLLIDEQPNEEAKAKKIAKLQDRKTAVCRHCGQPMLGHPQYYGYKYCSVKEAPLSKEEWLDIKKAERKAKLQQRQQQQQSQP